MAQLGFSRYFSEEMALPILCGIRNLGESRTSQMGSAGTGYPREGWDRDGTMTGKHGTEMGEQWDSDRTIMGQEWDRDET